MEKVDINRSPRLDPATLVRGKGVRLTVLQLALSPSPADRWMAQRIQRALQLNRRRAA